MCDGCDDTPPNMSADDAQAIVNGVTALLGRETDWALVWKNEDDGAAMISTGPYAEHIMHKVAYEQLFGQGHYTEGMLKEPCKDPFQGAECDVEDCTHGL